MSDIGKSEDACRVSAPSTSAKVLPLQWRHRDQAACLVVPATSATCDQDPLEASVRAESPRHWPSSSLTRSNSSNALRSDRVANSRRAVSPQGHRSRRPSGVLKRSRPCVMSLLSTAAEPWTSGDSAPWLAKPHPNLLVRGAEGAMPGPTGPAVDDFPVLRPVVRRVERAESSLEVSASQGR